MLPLSSDVDEWAITNIKILKETNNMMIRKITDEFGRDLEVDESTRKLYSYNNKKSQATYCAEIVENGKHTGFHTNYIVSEKITDVEARLNVWNSLIKEKYAEVVECAAKENDPDKKIWKSVVQYAADHQDEIFDENGDFIDGLVITDEQIQKLVAKVQELTTK